jgi:hypothetical protein
MLVPFDPTNMNRRSTPPTADSALAAGMPGRIQRDNKKMSVTVRSPHHVLERNFAAHALRTSTCDAMRTPSPNMGRNTSTSSSRMSPRPIVMRRPAMRSIQACLNRQTPMQNIGSNNENRTSHLRDQRGEFKLLAPKSKAPSMKAFVGS